jgi:hypothetical protein
MEERYCDGPARTTHVAQSLRRRHGGNQGHRSRGSRQLAWEPWREECTDVHVAFWHTRYRRDNLAETGLFHRWGATVTAGEFVGFGVPVIRLRLEPQPDRPLWHSSGPPSPLARYQ